MSIGTYGTIRPADVDIDDIDIYYNYMPNRYTANNDIFKLNSTDLLEYCYLPDDDETGTGGEDLLEGMYNLKLPAGIFNKLGIYTLYLKPKKYTTVIVDCSVLSQLPNIKGIVLDMGTLPEKLRSNNALQGYRVEYIDVNGNKTRNVVRYVVTSNKVSVTTENIGNTSQKVQRYKFDDVGSLLFLQLTPSSASDVKPNSTPFIGNLGQTILLSNTYFNPLVVEIDLVKNNIDTLSNYVMGEQIKDTQKGIVTYYDENRNITNQYNLYQIKENVDDDIPLYEVKEIRDTIDTSENFNEVTDIA